MKFLKASCLLLASFGLIALFTTTSQANNLSVSNVSLSTRNATSDTVIVEFDVNWENSWKNKINHDAIWLTVRLHDETVTPTSKNLCQVYQSGTNPAGSSAGNNSNLEIFVPTDKIGAFLRRSSNSKIGSVSSEGIQLTLDYGSCGFSDDAQVSASVLGIEMVYIPEGAFYAGDSATSTGSLTQGSSDSDPWYITSEDIISVTNSGSNGYRYVSAGNVNEDLTGASFTIPASFPKGYQGVYAMKYEITEAQWVEFVNSLPSAEARSNRDLTNLLHKNTDSVIKRNTISCSGSIVTCSTSKGSRALNYLSWMDLAAFLDWSGLRPMTELEFEKTARGPYLPLAGEYVWGTTNITSAAALSGTSEDGTETVTTPSANAHYGNNTLTGGDSSQGSEYTQGPIRTGVFATLSSTRETAGASTYGVMDLAGNVKEYVVAIGNSTGRGYTGSHGDGYLSTASGYEGNATVSDWPGLDANTSRGVTSGNGTGFKGGSWADSASALRTSDRSEAALGSSSALNTAGGRGVRTAH